MDLFNDSDELEYMMIEVDMKQSVFIVIFYFGFIQIIYIILKRYI